MAVYVNENGTVQTLATDGEPLNMSVQHYTAKFIYAYAQSNPWRGSGFEDQSFTLPFTPKAFVVAYDNAKMPVEHADSTNNHRIITSRDIAIGDNSIDIAAFFTTNYKNVYYHYFKINGNKVTIPKTTYTSFALPSVGSHTFIINFDVIFFY